MMTFMNFQSYNMLIKHVYQVILEYQFHAVIGLQGCASHFWRNAILKLLLPLRKIPNLRIANYVMVLKKFLLEEMIFYLHEVVRYGRYTLTVHLEVCASIVCVTFNWHWIISFVRFWVSLLFSLNVWILILSLSLFYISVGLIETHFREYSKSDFTVWATSL